MRPSQETVESLFQDEGLEYTVETVEAGNQVPEHKHPFDEVRVIVKGAMRYNVAGNEFILKEGDRLELPSNTRHWTKVESQSECVSIWAYRIN